MDFRKIAAGLVLAAFALPAPAQRSLDDDFDDAKKTWKEIEATMPGYPKTETLVPFNGGGASGHRFFIDEPSLSIGADGVGRYTLVVKTTGGATNVTYEGIRCEERHQKTYAVGQASGPMVAGLLADATGSLAPGLLFGAGMDIVGAAVAWWVRRDRPVPDS